MYPVQHLQVLATVKIDQNDRNHYKKINEINQ